MTQRTVSESLESNSPPGSWLSELSWNRLGGKDGPWAGLETSKSAKTGPGTASQRRLAMRR
eukprot:5940742-Pyramimonas_sp.AAC.1